VKEHREEAIVKKPPLRSHYEEAVVKKPASRIRNGDRVLKGTYVEAVVKR